MKKHSFFTFTLAGMGSVSTEGRKGMDLIIPPFPEEGSKIPPFHFQVKNITCLSDAFLLKKGKMSQ